MRQNICLQVDSTPSTLFSLCSVYMYKLATPYSFQGTPSRVLKPRWRNTDADAVMGLVYLYVREGHADEEVAGPVAAASESDGGRSGPLAEQLRHDEPRNRTRPDLKERHKEEHSRHADVAHP